MAGLEVKVTKKSYNVLVSCPRCGGAVNKENQGKDDKYFRVYALKCENCYTLLSFNLILRCESGSSLPGHVL